MNFHYSAPRHLLARLPILLPATAALTLTLPLGSCSLTSGAAIGGLVGAGIGQAVGGDTESTLVGAAIGAGVGAAIGYNVAKRREARLLASRRATEEEVEAAKHASFAVTSSSREKAIARAEAYAAEHGDEHQAAAVDAGPIGTDQQPVSPPQEVPVIEESEPADIEPSDTFEAISIPDDTMIGIVPLPSGAGVMFTDIKTGELIDNEVHQLEEISDVSGEAASDVQEDDEAKPFTLILSDKTSGKSRQYTAIYST